MAIPADYATFCELIEDDEANPGPTIGQWDLFVEPVWKHHPFLRAGLGGKPLIDQDLISLRRAAVLWRLGGLQVFTLMTTLARTRMALIMAENRAVSREHREAVRFELENATEGWEWPTE